MTNDLNRTVAMPGDLADNDLAGWRMVLLPAELAHDLADADRFVLEAIERARRTPVPPTEPAARIDALRAPVPPPDHGWIEWDGVRYERSPRARTAGRAGIARRLGLRQPRQVPEYAPVIGQCAYCGATARTWLGACTACRLLERDRA